MSEFKLEVSQDEGNGSHVFYVQCGIPLDKTTLQVAGLLLDGGYNPGEIEPLAEVAAAYVSVTEVQEAFNVVNTTGRTPRELAEDNEKLAERVKVLERACAEHDRAICQTLGKALGLPRYCDDPKNFPGATEADGVCVIENDGRSLAESAAKRIKVLEGQRDDLAASLEHTRYWYGCRLERLDDLMRSEATEEIRNRYFSIIANGTADIHEPPTYAQQMNTLKHQSERLAEQRDRLAKAMGEPLGFIKSLGEPQDKHEAMSQALVGKLIVDRAEEVLAQCTEGQAGGATAVQPSADHALFAKAIASKAIRWDSWGDDGRGEICTGRLCYATKLDADGVPELYPHLRDVIIREMAATKGAR